MIKKCPVCGVNILRFFAMTLAGFVFVFILEYIVHAVLLREQYIATSMLWRNVPDMKMYLPFATFLQFIFVFAVGLLFTRNFEDKGIKEGARFGLLLGFVIGVLQLSTYTYMPITLTIAFFWVGTAVVKCVGLGVIFSALYKDADEECTTSKT